MKPSGRLHRYRNGMLPIPVHAVINIGDPGETLFVRGARWTVYYVDAGGSVHRTRHGHKVWL